MLFPWRNHEVNIIFSHGFKFYIDYDAEAGGKVLLNENDVESCVLLERVSNRKANSYVKLNVKMEDYYRIKDTEKKTDE
jgi:hypothetical protein